MKIIAGVDIGNSTTEVCIGAMGTGEPLKFLTSAKVRTTGTKGTLANVRGIKEALLTAMNGIGRGLEDIALIRLNEAAPVIGDTAMETITETIITESSMIGHNPSTPAGVGHAVGVTLDLMNLHQAKHDVTYILLVTKAFDYEKAAQLINQAMKKYRIAGVIMQADEAVLVYNRLEQKLPILDEVRFLQGIPEGKLAAIEVAMPGEAIRMLSNPYGIATLLQLTPEETRSATPIAKSLIGKRSAVVIKTEHGNVKEQAVPAGEITFHGENEVIVPIDHGAIAIMNGIERAGRIHDISGQPHTNIGDMLEKVRKAMLQINDDRASEARITDILAVDTLAPIRISGALAGETCMEKAVGIAAMVKTDQLPMEEIAEALRKELGTYVEIGGVEAIMASLGALTTPGTQLPLAILDMGGGSTDAALISEDGNVTHTHQAGAGELVTLLIQTELGLSSRHLAEQIKRFPLAKMESMFHMRLESGEIHFFEEPIDPRLFGHLVLLTPDGFVKIDADLSMEKIIMVRRDVKRKVFVTNALRALTTVAPNRDLRAVKTIVLVGGSALDFEIPEMLTTEFSEYKIVCGRGNIRGTMGPRNAVATGLVLSYLRKNPS
ncbi:MAG: diol dehydratase reactivase subunit alpha [Eubacteriales bacterium]|nr:diol dehydratase reactivase subunit alpha [Eubacteriales bacterium]